MNGAYFALAALETGRQHVGQRELLLDLVDDLHVSHYLNCLVVDETVASACFALGWGVGGFSGEARVDPKVEKVGSERRSENRPDNRRSHAVLVRGGNGVARHDCPHG